MKFLAILLLIAFSSPPLADAAEFDPQISKLQFQGVFFGDFPSVDMICVRGLCPVGEVGVGINTQSNLLQSYAQKTDITHYNGVRISSPEYDYFDNKMCQVRFRIECDKQGQTECMEAVKAGFRAEYGLTLVDPIDEFDGTTKPKRSRFDEAFLTESGSTVLIVWNTNPKNNFLPLVKIMDETLMNMARLTANPSYVPRRPVTGGGKKSPAP